MTQPKTAPTNGERFDRILQYLADSEGNDIEIAALHEITAALWQLLTPEQENEFFERMAPLEAKAAEWADDDDNIATNAARIAFSLRRDTDLTPARLEEVVAAAKALDAIEEQSSFAWEKQPADWEYVCSRIADAIGSSHPESWSREVSRLRRYEAQPGPGGDAT